MATVGAPLKKTALAEVHLNHKAKMVDFSGWLMPVSYTSVLKEHETVRTSVGIFDVSHMGEARVSGPQAKDFLQHATINNLEKLQIGGGQYSAILNESGGFIDDLIVYRMAESEYFLCLNASNAEKDVAWLQKISSGFNVQVKDESSIWSQIAVQGPNSRHCLLSAFPALKDSTFANMGYMTCIRVKLGGDDCIVARTGYTGEHGYELYIPHKSAAKIWSQLVDQSLPEQFRAQPCGLGARDTLRLEACYLLYGNDMGDQTNPIEAGIKWAVKIDGPDFIGKNAVLKAAKNGPSQKIYAFKMSEDGIPRHGMPVFVNGEQIGEVTSGSVLPTVGGAGGMMMLRRTDLKIDDQVEVDIRGKRKLARIARRPLYTAKVN
jgi:aminomethyltransferase